MFYKLYVHTIIQVLILYEYTPYHRVLLECIGHCLVNSRVKLVYCKENHLGFQKERLIKINRKNYIKVCKTPHAALTNGFPLKSLVDLFVTNGILSPRCPVQHRHNNHGYNRYYLDNCDLYLVHVVVRGITCNNALNCAPPC